MLFGVLFKCVLKMCVVCVECEYVVLEVLSML